VEQSSQPKVAYVLAYDGAGPYADMVFASASMVQALHPDLERCLVADPRTIDVLEQADPELLQLFDTVAIAREVSGPVKQRSRELKIRLRQMLAGDLIYLDGDTLPLRPFAELATFDGELLGAHDRIAALPVPHIPFWYEPLFRRLGWQYPPDRYLNVGVLYLRDVPRIHALAAEWLARWQASAAVGCVNDQPAFNAAVQALGVEVGILPVSYNAMVTVSARFARGAKILHFFASESGERERAVTLLDHLVMHRRATGAMDFDAVVRARQRNYPWMTVEGISRNIQTGHYLDAATLIVRRVARRLSGELPASAQPASVARSEPLTPERLH
jgi:hypothetical protein